MVADGSWGVGVSYILGPLSDDRYTHSTRLVCSSLTSFWYPDHKIEIRNLVDVLVLGAGRVSLLYRLVPLPTCRSRYSTLPTVPSLVLLPTLELSLSTRIDLGRPR